MRRSSIKQWKAIALLTLLVTTGVACGSGTTQNVSVPTVLVQTQLVPATVVVTQLVQQTVMVQEHVPETVVVTQLIPVTATPQPLGEIIPFLSTDGSKALNTLLVWDAGSAPENAYALDREPGKLFLRAAPQSWPNFPQVLYQAQGDFIAQVQIEVVLGEAYQGAGLLVKPAGAVLEPGSMTAPGNWVFAMRHSGGNGQSIFCGSPEQEIQKSFDGSPAYLRIERTGDAFTCAYSADGNLWTPLHYQVMFTLPVSVDIALFAYSANQQGVEVLFSHFWVANR